MPPAHRPRNGDSVRDGRNVGALANIQQVVTAFGEEADEHALDAGGVLRGARQFDPDDFRAPSLRRQFANPVRHRHPSAATRDAYVPIATQGERSRCRPYVANLSVTIVQSIDAKQFLIPISIRFRG